MIISKMFKLTLSSFFLYCILIVNSSANEDFNKWLKKFQVKAINAGISENIVEK